MDGRDPHRPLVVRTAGDLCIGAVERIAFGDEEIVLAPEALSHVRTAREDALAALSRGERVYGVNTGLGYRASDDIEPADRLQHERSLVLGRAVGSAPFLPAEEARALLTVRLAGFLAGRAGVTPDLCDLLARCLNRGFTPAVPKDSVGCAGEIIPLAHAFSALMGVGWAVARDGSLTAAAAALAARGIRPLQPQPKEGIALVGGAPGAVALGIARLREVRSVARTTLVSAAAAIDAATAPLGPYSPILGRLSEDPLLESVMARFEHVLEGRGGTRALQAPVSFRVAPQVQAHLERSAARLEDDVRRALAAVQDSPAFVEGHFVSNGGFHQVEVAAGMDAMAAALARAGELSAQRIHRLLDRRFTGLPDQLTPGPAPRCGLVVVHKRAVGSMGELRRLAAPASVGVVDTSLGQEDAMTFGFEAAAKLGRALSLVREILACELLAASQAWWLRRRAGRGAPAPGLRDVEALVREAAEPVVEDRQLGDELSRIEALVEQGRLAGPPA